MTDQAFMTIDAYSECSDLPSAIRLNRDFIRHERLWARQHPDAATYGRSYHEQLDQFGRVLDACERIWQEEQVAVRQRVAARIRAEVPEAEDVCIPQAVESGDFSLMAC